MKKQYGIIAFFVIASLIITVFGVASNSENIIETVNQDTINESTEEQLNEDNTPEDTSEESTTLESLGIQDEVTQSQDIEFEMSKEEIELIREMPFACESPDGKNQAFLRLSDREKTIFDDIVVVDLESKKARVLSLDNVWYTTVLGVQWLNSDLIAFTGHVNPSLEVYVVFDAGTGDRIRKHDGVGFVWDKEMHHVYYSLPQPFFSEVRGNDKIMEDDDTVLYETDSDVLIIGGPALSESGEMYFFEWSEKKNKVSLVKAERNPKEKLKNIKKFDWDKPYGDIKVKGDESILVETLYSSDTYNLTDIENITEEAVE
ncbi:hypothetical protein [Alkaliphilus peptidifermentans]|uniref:Uncharacterized protein n=1 Tax=Alkaliphilus peptidifermentans DSM 18978 TaxID=1120976 RepID=A0A1G5FEG4_9FIRM|nr:hypothetical protein [Alkaliphilus peptidifermentans]SCY37645.1 hypothetical protein SAMN03080606_01392 [Alkaliphilus peptidifermentans DSM 18978]